MSVSAVDGKSAPGMEPTCSRSALNIGKVNPQTRTGFPKPSKMRCTDTRWRCSGWRGGRRGLKSLKHRVAVREGAAGRLSLGYEDVVIPRLRGHALATRGGYQLLTWAGDPQQRQG